MARRYYIETLGCPKNQVDSDKLIGTLSADGMVRTDSAEDADLVVVNTCAFIDSARAESVDVVVDLEERKRADAELVVTGCMAERYGDELADALGSETRVAGFGVPVSLGATRSDRPSFDLLNLPRPAATAPWAYVKVAEGCDRACGFCAIPSFRGPQRSRTVDDVVAEVEALGVREVVLVAQDLASFGRDQGKGDRQIAPLVDAVGARVDWVRLLYLYPSDLTDALVGAVLETGVPYFDLSLQHVSRPLVRRMRRWGSGEVFANRIAEIRALEPAAAFRSNFIIGYPGETEADHDQLLAFVEEAQLDWCGFFPYSREDGTYAADLDGVVPDGLVAERLAEVSELQDRITAQHQDLQVGRTVTVLVDSVGVARSVREAPEIDGIIEVPADLAVGEFATVTVTESRDVDLVAR